MPASGCRRLVVLGVLGAVLVAGCGGDDDETTTASSTTDTSVSSTSTTSTSTTTTPMSTTTTAAATSTTAASTPPAVTVIAARSGGGSGEVVLTWDAVAGATGYRVSRSSAPGGPFSVSADVNLATGAVTVADGVTNLWSPGAAEFFPVSSFEPGDPLPQDFEYVDVGGPEPRYYRVVAYDAAGDGPPSTVVCGVASGGASC